MGGDPNPQSTGESTSQMLQAYVQNLPALMQSVNSQLTPAANAQLEATRAVSGPTNDLASQLISQYAPGLASLGSQISDQTAKAGAATTQGVLDQSGQGIANRELAIDKSVNPNFYSTQDAAAGKLKELLGSINLNGLSEGESAAVERSLNQQNQKTGNVNVPSATNTVTNAMNYGGALQAKRTALGAALDTATNFLPQSKSNIAPIADTLSGAAAGSNTSNNVGLGQFQGVQSNAGQSANGTANNFLSQVGQLQQQQNQITSQRRDSLDRTTGVLGSLPSIS